MGKKKLSSERGSFKSSNKKENKKNLTAMALAIFIVLMLVLSSVYIIASNFGDSDNSQNSENNYTNDPGYISALANTQYPVAVLETSKGAIAVELYDDKVPNTCQNFINLVKDNFYTNLVFHRVANIYSTYPDRYIIQGGGFDREGNKKESPFGTIDLEINEDVRHVDGAISMARTDDPNSATSQFYICDGVHDFLDDNYAAFGKVIYGMDVVQEIAGVSTGTKTLPSGQPMSNWPKEEIITNKIIMVKE